MLNYKMRWIVLGPFRKRHVIQLWSAAMLLVTAFSTVAWSASLPISEREKIEGLINRIATFSDIIFIRNGKSYTAANAAKFLRGKWQAGEADINSTNDFIDKIGSFSSTTGKPYLIRFRDGREMSSALFLREQLKKIQRQK